MFIIVWVLIQGKMDTSSRATDMFYTSLERSSHKESNEVGSFTIKEPVNPAFSNLQEAEYEVFNSARYNKGRGRGLIMMGLQTL